MKFHPRGPSQPQDGHLPPRATPPSRRRRAAFLLAALLAGVGASALGLMLSGRGIWLAAVPVALAVGWFAAEQPTTVPPPSPDDGPVLW